MRDAVRKFANEVIKPRVVEMGRGSLVCDAQRNG